MKVQQLWLKRTKEAQEALTRARRTSRAAAALLKKVAHAHRPAAKQLEKKLHSLESMLENERLKVPEYSGFRNFLEEMAQSMAHEQEQLAELEIPLRRLRKSVEGRAAKAVAAPPKERKKRRQIKRRKEAAQSARDVELYKRQTALMQELNKLALGAPQPIGSELWKLTEAIIDNPSQMNKPDAVEREIREKDLYPWLRQLLDLRNVVFDRERIRLEGLK